MLKKLREKAKGKKTFAGIAALAAVAFGLTPEEVELFFAAGGALLAVYGRWQATRG